MRIVLDLQACQGESRFRGIGRYSFFLAKAIIKEAIDRKYDVYVLLNSYFQESIEELERHFNSLLPKGHFLQFTVDENVSYQQDPTRQNLQKVLQNRESVIEIINPDIVHISDPFGGFLTTDNSIQHFPNFDGQIHTVCTLYDLIPYMYPHLYLVDDNYKQFYLNRLDKIQNCTQMLAISDYTRKEALENLKKFEGSIVNISGAVDEMFSKKIEEYEDHNQDLSKYGIKKEYILYVPGGFDPRKNFGNLIKAYSLLPDNIKNRYQLVIGSKFSDDIRRVFDNYIEQYHLQKDDIVLTGYVEDDILINMYERCALYVFPSIHEGFGLPLLEAMACGAPAIGSNVTSIPEVIGYKKALFDPYNAEDIANKIKEALMDPDFREDLKKDALTHVQNFTWEKSAKLAVDAFEMLVKNK